MPGLSHINIHSHHPASNGEWVIQSLSRDFEKCLLPGRYSLGIHPWYISEQTWRLEFSKLQEYCNYEQVLAIGECGLDKICKTPFSLQQEVFETQVNLANKINKPLIIHCVKAFDNILQTLQRQHNRVPVIFHGYNKNIRLAESLLKQGHWLSFGKALLQPGMENIFKSIQAERFFLETDDSETGIDIIYDRAASIRKITREQLSLQLEKNVLTVFNKTVST